MTINEQIKQIQDLDAYVNICLMPGGDISIYLSWFGENDRYFKTIRDVDLPSMLEECFTLVNGFLHGDKTLWNIHKEEEPNECSTPIHPVTET